MYDWRCYKLFFVNDNQIPQHDGNCGDINSRNVGERLRAMIGDWEDNQFEIREAINEIQEYEIDECGVQQHARFNHTGLAMQESIPQ